MRDLKKELSALINSFSLENSSNTPDFILAEYLMDCLFAYEKAIKANRNWGKAPEKTEMVFPNKIS